MSKLADFLGLQQVEQLRGLAADPPFQRIFQQGAKVTVMGPFLTEPVDSEGLDPHKRAIPSAPETRMRIYNPNNSGFELAPVSIIRAVLPLEFGRGYLRYFILWTADERVFLDRLEYEQVAVFRADSPLAARRYVEVSLSEEGGQVEDRLPPEVKMVRLVGGHKREGRSGRARSAYHPIRMQDRDHSVHSYPCHHCGTLTTRRACSHFYDRRERFFCSEDCQSRKG